MSLGSTNGSKTVGTKRLVWQRNIDEETATTLDVYDACSGHPRSVPRRTSVVRLVPRYRPV